MKTETMANWQNLASIAEEFKTENLSIPAALGTLSYELIRKVGRLDISKNPSEGAT